MYSIVPLMDSCANSGVFILNSSHFGLRITENYKGPVEFSIVCWIDQFGHPSITFGLNI